MSMGGIKDELGQKYGRLLVVGRGRNSKAGKARWLCLCVCGNKSLATGENLRSGHCKSCGCLRIPPIHRTHGLSYSPVYKVWSNMKDRCLNTKCSAYKDYGGRGVKICKSWLKFENFFQDLGDSYKNGLWLDRIDNNGNYELSNCRWTTFETQNMNRRNTRKLMYKGELKTLIEWSKIMGINHITLRGRIRNNYPEDLLFAKKYDKRFY